MKLLRLSFSLILVTFLSACSDDEEPICTQADWVGTYTGNQNCGAGDEDVTLTIAAAGPTALLIKAETATVETQYDPLTPNNCDIEESQSAGTATLTVEFSLDGDRLTLTEVLSEGTNTSTCTTTATRN